MVITRLCYFFNRISQKVIDEDELQHLKEFIGETMAQLEMWCFIMHEVVNVRGRFFHESHDLAMNDKYIGLREWDNQLHRAATSSSPKED